MNFQGVLPVADDWSSDEENEEETETVESPLKGGEFAAQMSAEFSENMIGTDVTFRVRSPSGVAEIGCHKFILASRSKVFNAMFSVQMKENLTNIIELPELEYSTVLSLIKFFYTDKVEESSIDMDLLAVADQYDIEELKQQCATVLSYKLKVEDAVNTFVAAKRYRSETLARACLDVIGKNFGKVKKTEEWIQNYGPELAQMLAETLVSKNQSMASKGTPTAIAFWFNIQ